MTKPDPLHATSVRSPAMVLVIVLLLAACGRGGDPAAGVETPEATPETGATEIRVGGEDDPSGDAEGPEATPSTEARGDAEDPADTVAAFLRAVEAEDYATQLALSSGPVHLLTRFRDIIRQENERRGATTDNEVTVTRAPELVEASETQAEVAVEATIVSTVSGEHGELASDATIETPVRLQRTEAGWRIHDLVYSGRALGPEHFPVETQRTSQGVRLEVAAFLGYKQVTATLIRFVNEAGDDVPLRIGRILLRAADGSEQEAKQIAVEQRDTPAIFVGWDLIEARPQSLRVDVEREDTNQSWSYDLSF